MSQSETPTATLILRQGREKPVLNRHPWVFSGAISRIEGEPEPGDIVLVADNKGTPLATAYFNPRSQIRARILSWDTAEAIDESFWQARLDRAITGRTLLDLPPETNAFRLVNAEADGLPGLVVDQYDDYLVVQCLTLGIDRRKELIFDLLQARLNPAGILERSDVDVRQKEGLPQTSGVRRGAEPPAELVVRENKLSFLVDVHHGHKTGFYLDQRDNRAAVGRLELLAGKDILNVFAYTGAFGVYAAANEAQRITHVDSSAPSLELAERAIELNGFTRPDDQYIAGDAFEVLRYYREEGEQFDVVILDPPKFAHTQGGINRATRGYKDLNWLALRLLRPGGLLATFSCSGLVSADLFQKVVFGAAVDAEREVQILQHLGQSADHPVLLTFPESAYLKGLLCRVW
ncbi:MAG: class I SAM-dependent rRNA methyltransferase [Chloroflexota bacterium]